MRPTVDITARWRPGPTTPPSAGGAALVAVRLWMTGFRERTYRGWWSVACGAVGLARRLVVERDPEHLAQLCGGDQESAADTDGGDLSGGDGAVGGASADTEQTGGFFGGHGHWQLSSRESGMLLEW